MPSEEEKNVFLESLQNQQAQQQTPGQEPPESPQSPKKKKPMSGTTLFATLFLLFLLVLTLLIFIISFGGAKNPILQSFNIESGQVKDFLKSLVNWTFGSLVILQLLLFSIGLFRGFSTPKEQSTRRRRSFIFGGVSGGLIFAVVLAWLGTFAYVDSLEASATGDIEVLNISAEEKIIAPLTISFSAESIERDLRQRGERIERFRWSKNSDGSFEIDGGRDPRVDMIFREQGRQIVQLMVELEDAEPEFFDIEFAVDSVVFQAEPERGEVPLNVAFDAREVTQDLAVKTFEWDFDGDDKYERSSASSRVEHTFSKIGVFTVGLRVILQDDQVRSFERIITVTGSTTDRIKALIDASPTEGTAPLKVSFSAENSFTTEGKISGYYWSVGEGDLQLRGDTVSHTFKEPGVYRVELRIENTQGLEDATNVEVSVLLPTSAPIIQLKTTPVMNESGAIISEISPLTVSFDAAQTTDPDDDIISFEWDFDGDGEADEFGEQVSHTFDAVGSFPVTLTVEDAEENRSVRAINVVTKKEAIQAVVLASPETGAAPLTITFDGSQSSCGVSCRILSYAWDFDDGTPVQVTGAHTTHTFTQVGTFTVGLKITTDGGQTVNGEKIIAVRVPPLKACFTPSRLSGPAPLTVSIKDCSIGTIKSWQWDFGDGVISNERVAKHVFQNPGKYSVTLLVTDENNTTSESSQVIEVE